jgi:hypothetical protein
VKVNLPANRLRLVIDGRASGDSDATMTPDTESTDGASFGAAHSVLLLLLLDDPADSA